MKNRAGQAAKAADQVGARLTAIHGASGEMAGRINDIGVIVARMDALSGEVSEEAARQGEVAATIADDATQYAANVLSGSEGLSGRADTMAHAVEGFLASVRRV